MKKFTKMWLIVGIYLNSSNFINTSSSLSQTYTKLDINKAPSLIIKIFSSFQDMCKFSTELCILLTQFLKNNNVSSGNSIYNFMHLAASLDLKFPHSINKQISLMQ